MFRPLYDIPRSKDLTNGTHDHQALLDISFRPQEKVMYVVEKSAGSDLKERGVQGK